MAVSGALLGVSITTVNDIKLRIHRPDNDFVRAYVLVCIYDVFSYK